MPTPDERDDQETQTVVDDPAQDGAAGVEGGPPPGRGDGRYDPYPDPVRPAVARVPVRSDQHPGMEAIVDAADLPLVTGKRWSWATGRPGCPGSVIWRMDRTHKPSLARVILGLVDDADRLICHLNDDRLDCRRENLALRTRSEVRRASPKLTAKAGKACDSRFRGVSRTESGRKWAATIRTGDRTWNIGRFRSEVDAALAYDAALRQLTGEAAPVGLNFPDPAEAERLRALETVVEEDTTWPPPGMVDRHGACVVLGVSLTTLTAWDRTGRITCGQVSPFPGDRPGRCKLYPVDELERARAAIEREGKPYPDPSRPGVWRVPLAAHHAKREALIDEVDLHLVEGRSWNWSPRSDEGGRADGVVVPAVRGARQEPLHRLIAGVTDPKVRVSFVSGDGLDCRRANLVVRTLAETLQSTRKMATRAGRACASSFKGVRWDADRGQWTAQIRKGRVAVNLGRFAGEDEAAGAYDAAARALFGAHAYLNFPDRTPSDRAMADARAAIAGGTSRTSAGRRRQRELERELRWAAAERRPVEGTTVADETIPGETARQSFDVSTAVWQRWHQFGWLNPAVAGDGGAAAYPVAEIERLLRRCGIVALPYPDPERPGCYRVPLIGETSRGMEALVDAGAVPLVRARRWMFAPADTGRGGEVRTPDPSENLRLHYVVMGMTADARSLHLGHRNDDPLDCRRANLVVRTLTDTHANQRKQATFNGRPCTSRFKGVCRDRRAKKWVASITKDRRQSRLGSFRDEVAAAQAYDAAAREFFGEHARLNFPDGVDARLEGETAATARAEAA